MELMTSENKAKSKFCFK